VLNVEKFDAGLDRNPKSQNEVDAEYRDGLFLEFIALRATSSTPEPGFFEGPFQ
jgi:hypothetical protein